MDSSLNPIGLMRPADAFDEFNSLSFAISQAIKKMQTSMPVRVVSCSNFGGLNPVGTVSVVPLVDQIDGANPPNSWPHATIFNVPYVRIQGGSNAVIIDPVEGDIGICLFASRDISKVKSTKAQALPGSFRCYDWGDAMYIGGLLNGTPTQVIQFTSSGIFVISPTSINLSAPAIVAESTGGTPHALVIDDWLSWYTSNVQPFLVSKGYAGPLMPTVSTTTVLQGQ